MRRKRRKHLKYFYIPFWLLIIGSFAGLIVMQASRYADYRQELERLDTELRQEEQIAEDLRLQQAFIGSDAYIERLAREWLGYVRQDEIVFKNIAER